MLCNKKASTSYVLSLVFLAVLLYIFHTELFITGVRLYVTLANSPRAEQLLGNYYQNSAHLNTALADTFYASALHKYKAELPHATSEQQTTIKFNIGKLYQCGRGAAQNLNEAKRWYDDALQSGTANHQTIVQDIQKALSETEQGIAHPHNFTGCHPKEGGFSN